MAGRRKIHTDQAAKQRAWRNRNRYTRSGANELVEALIAALDRGSCSKVFKALPEQPDQRMRELARRLQDLKLVAHKSQAARLFEYPVNDTIEAGVAAPVAAASVAGGDRA